MLRRLAFVSGGSGRGCPHVGAAAAAAAGADVAVSPCCNPERRLQRSSPSTSSVCGAKQYTHISRDVTPVPLIRVGR